MKRKDKTEMIDSEKIKILIVDDDPTILKATEKIIKSEGYVVITAENGRDCLNSVEKENPDIVLLDVVMPDMNGREVAIQIKKKFKPAPLIILTSGVEISSDKQSLGLELGADSYIPRPVPKRELIARVNAFSKIKLDEKKLKSMLEHVEETVRSKTAEADENAKELKENFKLSVQREFRIKELRDKITQLKKDMGIES
jgi:DNA-binding response OmpR family regulator